MSGILTNFQTNFLEVATDSDLAAVSGNSLVTGQLACSKASGFYTFDNSVLDLGNNDILLDDNSGIWRQYTGQFIYVNDSSQITKLFTISTGVIEVVNTVTSVLNSGTTIDVAINNLLTTDFVIVQLMQSDNSCYVYNEAYPTENGVLTLTFDTAPGNFTIGYLIIRSTGAPLSTGLTYDWASVNGFIPVTTYDTTDEMTAESTTPRGGSLAFCLDSGLFYYDTNVVNLSQNDYVLDNNSGAWRYLSPSTNPYLYVDDDNILSNLNVIQSSEATYGEISGSGTETIIIVGGLSLVTDTSVPFIQLVNNIAFQKLTATCSTNTLVIETSESVGDYDFKYLIFSQTIGV